MQVRVKKLHPKATLPQYATPGAACFDLVAHSVEGSDYYTPHVGGGMPVTFGTGLVFEIPPGKVMLIFSRSGHGFKDGIRLSNCVGVIDSDYRGEVKVRLAKDTPGGVVFPVGSRIAQAMIVDCPHVELVEADSLEETARGEGGFGSTGA